MIDAGRLGGKLAAHAVWSISGGATLIPMLGTLRSGQTHMTRLAFEDLAAAVAQGKKQLDDNVMDADDAMLVYDARITLDERKVDALIVELRTYCMPGARATLAIPYTPATAGFAVHKPKLIEWDHCEDFDIQAMLESFWEGVDSHEEAAKVWNAALDESF